jgi:general secretion pathway protein A
MYNDFFGLKTLPFNLTPDPKYLYVSAKHGEVLAGLNYAIQQRKGFVVLTGDAGTGKTTLLSSIFNRLPAGQVQSSILLNPILTPSEFLEFVMLDFGMGSVPVSKAQRLWKFQEFLLQTYREKRIAVLVIDEAHKLGIDVLEEIRLLGNFEYGADKFLQIVLLGQCELDDLLDRQDMRQFKQRVALRMYIDPLAGSEIGDYIRFRWTKAGGTEIPFTPDAVDGIARFSRGIPRLVNSICDGALLAAYAEGRRSVTAPAIRETCTNLGLEAAPAPMPSRLQPDPISSPEVVEKRISRELPSFGPMRADVREQDDLPSFVRYGSPRRNSTLLRLLSRKSANSKNGL